MTHSLTHARAHAHTLLIHTLYRSHTQTTSAGCDADRTRNWMTREGGARAAFLDARESLPDSSSLVCTWRQHGILSALRQWVETAEAKEGNKWAAFVCKGGSGSGGGGGGGRGAGGR